MNDFKLPIYKYKDELIKVLKNHNVLIVESPTGSGKTTQLPRIIYEAGFAKLGKIGVTQPRRIATVSIAEYIAKHIGVNVGEEVGYKIRFEEITSPKTKIKLMTDGVLLQELKKDTLLYEYDVIIIDEAHERSLNIDFILGLIKDISRKRDDFKIIVSSATINTKIFSKYFNNAPVVSIETITYPVQIIYNPPLLNTSKGMILKIKEIVLNVIKEKKAGDILIFLSGEKEIKETIKELQELNSKKNLIIFPLYGRMPKEAQEQIFMTTPKNKRKIIVSTNIAETSITIENIKIVIDSGKVKTNKFQTKTHTYSLQEVPISKSSATQRAGRAGRLSKGTCYRLYKREDYQLREDYQKEEIYRTDLSEVVLRMADIGIRDFTHFDFISKPSTHSIQTASKILKSLDAINNKNELTEIGKYMILFPLIPAHSRALVEAMINYPQAIYQTTIGLSFLSTSGIFLLPQNEEMEARQAHLKYKNPMGDLIGFVNIFEDFKKALNKEAFTKENYLDLQGLEEIANVQMQLENIISKLNIPIIQKGVFDNEGYLKSIMRGMRDYICFKTSKKKYKTIKAQNVIIHPGSLISTDSVKYFVAGEIIETTKMYARSIGVLKKEWIDDIILNEEFKHNDISSKENQITNTGQTKIINEIKIGKKIFKAEYKNNIYVIKINLETLKEIIFKNELNNQNNEDLKKIKIQLMHKNITVFNNKKFLETIEIVKNMGKDWHCIKKYETKNVNIDEPEKMKNLLECTMQFISFPPKKNALFLSLETDYSGNFRLKPKQNFIMAIEESIESIKSLIENKEYIQKLHFIKKLINKVYKKLNYFF
ncbi:ATP-dependent RNA helicase [Borreliella burgdorferi]|uniref:ATP-dependent RNA helicase HrpA n=11 Tax=Borreliella burgdorferi TaxID=139 RepID=HRPA_BORBU|nr:ATP-dependent RNA helicase [Borreliella burgdorferi]O51767.1 RecName: Full=ATP-dependent RNA helicase HrpA [Borreliella burgdorferi B31]AGS66822.1 ATP-dependent helicase HrpA [Borreliella burgdorferi CA382]AAC67162.1 ATP-dependent helicase HrpA [Borreliella burgdorferi B31]ADQ29586.1 ATP-dependent helicase HrpA [Borreliella burgdorferi N40]ADQ30598.1 ATP-dependent helicase HrpA [Borreliella burgdorferi JD1]ARS30558.1 ATP-dependent helicase [Borreliella burgdorferi]